MVDEDLPIGIHSYTEMLQMFNSMNDAAAGLEFYQTYVAPNVSIFTDDNSVAQLLRIYNGLGDHENAQSTFQHFLDHFPAKVGENCFNVMIRHKIYTGDINGMQKIISMAASLKGTLNSSSPGLSWANLIFFFFLTH